MKKKDKKTLLETITSSWKEKEYTGKRSVHDAIKCYMLALFTGQKRGLKMGDLAALSLRLAWLHRYLSQEDKEHYYLQHAKNAFTHAYQREDLPIGNLRQDTLLYLLGELNFRLGEYRQAVKWFNQCVSLPQGECRPAIKKKARNRWQDAKEEYKRKESAE